jgi:polyisoprenoid-binding protein YceI
MKRALLTIALLASASIAESQTTRLVVGGDSKLWIEGASNVNSWICRATTIDATIDVDSAFANSSELPGHLRSVTVKVPVAALSCGRAQMERSLRSALKVEESPSNAFVLATLHIVGTDERDGKTLRAAGTLTLAGRENAVRLDIDAARDSAGGFEARGAIPIVMSDYGVEPPTALFGVVRCADRVVVKFALTVGPTAGAVSASTTSLPH